MNRRFAALAALLGLSGALPAVAAEPLYVRNLSPVAGLRGLPSQRTAVAQAEGTLAVALHSAIASHYVLDSSSDEYLNLDGETVRVALELRYGLARDWDIQLELPWLKHSGGKLDKLIDNWHDLWGMSDGGRSRLPRELLNYRYANPAAGFALDHSASGPGDVSLALNYTFYRVDAAVASLVLGYKSGLGEDDDLLGSGADDGFVAVRFSGDHQSNLPLRWSGQLGYLRAGHSDLLESIQERHLWFAGLSLDWVLSERWSLLAQLDSHAAPTSSDIAALGDTSGLFTVGLRWRFAPLWSIEASVVEDILVETAADVAFQASLRYHP